MFTKLSLFFFLVLLATVSTLGEPTKKWKRLLPYSTYNVVFNPLDKQKLITTGRGHRLWRSDDAGTSWSAFYSGDTFVHNQITSIVLTPADTSMIFVGGFLYDGIRRSTNSGESFKRVLVHPNFEAIWALSDAIAVDPDDPRVIYVAAGSQVNSAVYKTTDLGETWEKLVAYNMNRDTIHLCTITIRPDSNNIIFLGCKRGKILRSDDYGQTFRLVKSNGDSTVITIDTDIPKIVFNPVNPQRGYFCAFYSILGMEKAGGVFRTTDGGHSWNRTALVDTCLWAIEVVPTPDGGEDLFVGGFRLRTSPPGLPGPGVVRRTTDFGETWINYDNEIPWLDGALPEMEDSTLSVWMLRYSPALNRMFMATQVGLFELDEPVVVKVPDVSVTDCDPFIANRTIAFKPDCYMAGTMRIYDVTGREYWRCEVSQYVPIPPGLNTGIFYYTITNGKSIRTGKLFLP